MDPGLAVSALSGTWLQKDISLGDTGEGIWRSDEDFCFGQNEFKAVMGRLCGSGRQVISCNWSAEERSELRLQI